EHDRQGPDPEDSHVHRPLRPMSREGTEGCRNDDRKRGPDAERHADLLRHADETEEFVENRHRHCAAAYTEHAGKETGERTGRRERYSQPRQVVNLDAEHESPDVRNGAASTT